MKKMLVLFLTLSVVMVFSLTAAALYEPGEEVGWNFDQTWGFWEVGGGIFENYTESKFESIFDAARGENTTHYVVVEGIQVEAPDGIKENWGPQNAQIKVPARLYIPCYLEMMLVGNAGKTKVKTIGIDDADNPIIRHGSERIIMLFHPELTGVVDEDWNFINAVDGDRIFSSIGPGADKDPDNAKTFIHACDIFRVQVYGNIGYNVSLTADPFAMGTDNEVYIQTRYFFDPAGEMDANDHEDWSETINLGFAEFEGLTPCNTYVMFFQFRVPWIHMDAGMYETCVYFKIYADDFGNNNNGNNEPQA